MGGMGGDLLFKLVFEYESIFQFMDAFKVTSQVVASGTEKITGAVNEVNQSFKGLSGLMKDLPGLNIAFNGFTSIFGNLTDSVKAIQTTNRQLNALVGSSKEFNDVQKYLLKTANDYGLAVDDISKSYVGLLRLQKEGVLYSNEATTIYEGLIGFANKTGASSQNVGKTLDEMFKVISSGVVSLPELETATSFLPGLLREIQKSSGLTAQAFNKMLESGQMTGDTFSKNLVFAMQKYQIANQTFQNDAKKSAGDLGPTLNRLNNQITLLKTKLAEPFTNTLTPLINHLIVKINEAITYIEKNGSHLAGLSSKVEAAFRPIVNASIIVIGKVTEVFVSVLPYLVKFVELIAGAIKWVADFIVENTALAITLWSIYKAVQTLIWIFGILGKIRLAMLALEFIGMEKVIRSVGLAFKALTISSIVTSFATLTTMIGSAVAVLGYLAYSAYAFATTPLGVALIALTAGFYAVYRWASASNEEMEKVAEATRKNLEILSKFREATDELNHIKVSGNVVEEINQIRAAVMVGRIAEEEGLKTVRELVKAVRDAEAERAEQVQKTEAAIANKRMFLSQQLELLQEKQREEEKRIEEAKAAEAEKSLQTILDGRKSFDSAVLESAKLTSQKIVELEKAAADKIKDLQDQLAMEKMSLSDKIRELRRKEMSDFDAQADLEAQIGEKMLMARKALEEGDSQKSRALGEEIESLVGNIEDVDKAVSLLEQVSGLTQDAIQSNINEVQKFSSELAKTDGVKSAEEIKVQADVEGALKEIDTLEQELAGLKDKEIRIDVVRVMSNIETEKQRAQAEAEAAARAQAAGGDTEAVAEAMQSAAADTSTAADSQKEAADSLKEAADSLKESATPTQAFATGGSVPGVGDTDTVPAMLTPGEFVVTKPRVERYQGLFDFLNFAPLQAVDKFIATRMNLGGLVQSMPTLHLNEGGMVPALAPAMAPLATPVVETIRFEWTIGGRAGVVNTLRSERQNLQSLMNAINETGRGL